MINREIIFTYFNETGHDKIKYLALYNIANNQIDRYKKRLKDYHIGAYAIYDQRGKKMSPITFKLELSMESLSCLFLYAVPQNLFHILQENYLYKEVFDDCMVNALSTQFISSPTNRKSNTTTIVNRVELKVHECRFCGKPAMAGSDVCYTCS